MLRIPFLYALVLRGLRRGRGRDKVQVGEEAEVY
jgi:hypothetical protein